MGADMTETVARGLRCAARLRKRGPRRVWPAAALTATALLLGACAAAGPPLMGVEAVSIVNTQKTLGDHFLSLTSGQDCSTLRAQKGGHYCVERYENEPVAEPLYCYRTLAAVTCYDRPSTNPRDRLVGIQRGGPLPTH